MGSSSVGIAVAGGVLLVAGLARIFYVVPPALHLSMAQQVNKLLGLPLWWRLILVIRGIVSEELCYRGFGIERLQELTRSRAVAGIALSVLYLWRRNLCVTMITHLAVDGVGVLAA